MFPGEWEPGEGKCRPEEGGEAADRGGQVSVVCAEQPRTSVHRPGSSDPGPPLSSSSQQLQHQPKVWGVSKLLTDTAPPPANRCTTLPALTPSPSQLTTEDVLRNRRLTSMERDWLEIFQSVLKTWSQSNMTDQRVCHTRQPNCNYLFRFCSSLCFSDLLSVIYLWT